MFAKSPRASAYICTNCLRRQNARHSYTTASVKEPPPPPPASGAAKLTNRRLISLHGAEAPKFLQGLVSNSVRPESRAGFYAAFLTGQGKVLNDVFIYPTLGSEWHKSKNQDEQHGYMVEIDSTQAESLFRHMKKHKLRSKFNLRLLDEGELNVWSVWDEDDRWTAHGKAVQNSDLGLTDCRAPGMGKRLLLPQDTAAREVDEAPLCAYTIRRYLRGVVEGQAEIPWNNSLPMNYNFDIMGGIDFKKGCYVGQELTIRTHHTGVVRRRVIPVALYERAGTPPEGLAYDPSVKVGEGEDGVDIRKDDARKKVTGKLVGSVGNVGLGMCRLEQMSDLTVSAEGSSFSPDDRFVMQTSSGQELGIKAFIPDWMRGRIREYKTQKRVE